MYRQLVCVSLALSSVCVSQAERQIQGVSIFWTLPSIHTPCEAVSDDEACALVAASLAGGTPPADACRALLQNASARGSRDDKAAIVVRLGAAAAAEAARSTSCEI